MIVDARTEDVELRELEALWEAPTVEERSVRRPPRAVTRFLARRGWRLLTIAWPVVLGSMFLAPDSNAEAVVPWWGWTLFLLHFSAVVGMVVAALGKYGSQVTWSLGAASLGVGLGVGCLTTGHHASGWAIYEFGAFCALALMSAATLAAGRVTEER
jgi:peptidoglycan/LPS O-acetylase OafA/YrhL